MLASVALARRMVAPIRRLQDGAARVGKGELDHRIDIHTGDELEALADEFNHTTERLQESQRDLEQKVEARTADLTQSLEQQTATAEVLRVISGSLTDAQPVFEVIAKLAERLCEADVTIVSRFDGTLIQLVALRCAPGRRRGGHATGISPATGLRDRDGAHDFGRVPSCMSRTCSTTPII